MSAAAAGDCDECGSPDTLLDDTGEVSCRSCGRRRTPECTCAEIEAAAYDREMESRVDRERDR